MANQPVKCTGCGMELKGSYSRGKQGRRYPYYHHYNKHCPLARSRKRLDMHNFFISLKMDDPDHQMLSKKEYLERKHKIEAEIEAVRIERNKCEVAEVSV